MIVHPGLVGRLGNFMFEVANAYAYAKKHGCDYCIPDSPYLKCFPELKKCVSFPLVTGTYNEPTFAYEEIPKINTEALRLNGYFQSEKYFLHCADEIKTLFRNPIRGSFDYYFKIEGAVAIHHRLGDYKKYNTRFSILTDRYISDSIKYFTDKGHDKFLVFSDGMDEAKQKINNTIFPNTIINYSEGHDEYTDLISGSACTIGNIISASSFSWWQAWLNPNPNKIVISPKQWFPHNQLDYSDVIPDSWLKFDL